MGVRNAATSTKVLLEFRVKNWNEEQYKDGYGN